MALMCGGVVALLANDIPLIYRCASPLFFLEGAGLLFMQASYKSDDSPTSDNPVCPGGWDEGSLAAFHYAKKDVSAAVNQVAVYIGSGDKNGFRQYFGGVTDSAWAQEVFHKAKEKARK